MKRVKVIGLTSFSGIGISFYPGMEAEIDEAHAKNWIEAGLVKKANDEIENAQLIEEPKVPSPEEIERLNLEAMAKQYGFNAEDLFQYNNEYIEDLIHGEITKKREEREAKLKETQGQENLEGGSNNEAPVGEDTKGKKPQPSKPRQVTDAGKKVE